MKKIKQWMKNKIKKWLKPLIMEIITESPVPNDMVILGEVRMMDARVMGELEADMVKVRAIFTSSINGKDY